MRTVLQSSFSNNSLDKFKNNPSFHDYMDGFSYQIKIPKDRIAVLIGKKGETKRLLEDSLKITLDIDSHEGDITIVGEDALNLYSGREIIRAIGRGFNPDLAMLLLKQDYAFEILTLPETDKKNHMTRIKGRVIGTDGKTRRIIEDTTECYISVYGKTVSVIGRADSINIARRAIEMILKGSPHSTVYRWLEKMRRELKRREMEENLIGSNRLLED
ncbi:MAG: KH domain-containing protein [archaeon]